MTSDKPTRKSIPAPQAAATDLPAEASEPQQAEEQPQEDLPRDRIAELEAQVEAEKDKALRAIAELQNYRRRAQEEAAQRSLYANEGILFDLITVLDHFEMACEAAEANEHTQVVCKGYEMILQQLRDVMSRHGLQIIQAEPGEDFDPNLHEAVEGVPTEESNEGTIVRVLRKGYRLHDRVLRPAQVAVAVRHS
ncbi:MAG: nucleotide exchange factor GrpE [Armatimonadetes bacterium]|nr:nucleotide exchange factor GrpE [Armatimonadota bacterium]